MPVYEYKCIACGPFEARRPMTEAASTLACPECRVLSPRAFTAPGVRRVAPALVGAVDRAERSRYEPSHEVRASGHGHAHPHRQAGRPWQIGH